MLKLITLPRQAPDKHTVGAGNSPQKSGAPRRSTTAMGTGTFTTRIFCAWCTPCCEAASSTRARSGKPDAFLEPFYTTYDHLPRQARDKRRESSTKRRITQGHGLKITQQNDTLIENCTVTDNRWQGIWVGGESAGNWDLRILGCTIERNHMCVQCT